MGIGEFVVCSNYFVNDNVLFASGLVEYIWSGHVNQYFTYTSTIIRIEINMCYTSIS